MISEADKAYAAGVIDSDGCIRVVKDNRRDIRNQNASYYPAVLVSQADGEAIQFLQKKWGGCIHKSAQARGRELFIFRWAVSWKKAEDFLVDIQPYLLIKKRQADLALEIRPSVVRTGDLRIQARRADGTTMPLPQEEIKRREEIFVQIKEMKIHHNHPTLTLKGVA